MSPLPTSTPSPRRRWLPSWFLGLGMLAIAALLRAPDLVAGWPYGNYVDEGNLLRPAALALRGGSWDTGDFNYPTLPAYLAASTVAARAWLRGEPALAPRSPYEQRYYDVLPPALLRAGRLWSFLFSLGTVLVAGLLARVLADARAGWLAAWLAALLPALVIRGGNANVDVVATFFCLLAFWSAERAARSAAGWREAALAGLAAGLAVTAKYTLALVLPAIGLRLLLAEGDWPRRLRGLGTTATVGLLGLVLGMPAVVLAPGRVWEGIITQASRYRGLVEGALWDQAVRRAEWDHPFDGPELGYVFLALVALGAWRLAGKRQGRAALLVFALFALALLAPLLAYTFRPFRNLLPAVALACPLAGCALSELAARLPGLARGRWGRLAALVPVLVPVLLPVLLYGRPLLAYAVSRFELEDSRKEAIDAAIAAAELEAEAGAGVRVCVARELAVLPSELARLPAGAVFVPALEPGSARDWAQCSLALLPARALPGLRLPGRELGRFGEVPVHLDPSLYRGNRQRIHLWRLRSPS